MTWRWLFAAGESLPAGTFLGVITALIGVIGSMVGAFVWVFKREAARSDRFEAKVLEMLPHLVEATAALGKSNELVLRMGALLDLDQPRPRRRNNP